MTKNATATTRTIFFVILLAVAVIPLYYNALVLSPTTNCEQLKNDKDNKRYGDVPQQEEFRKQQQLPPNNKEEIIKDFFTYRQEQQGKNISHQQYETAIIDSHENALTTTLQSTSPIQQRNVQFLNFSWDYYPQNDNTHLVNHQDAFSASWWSTRQRFLQYDQVESMTPSPEGASFEVFMLNILDNRIQMTQDWLDLSVEHMSKWWKMVTSGLQIDKVTQVAAYQRILEIFRNYVHSPERYQFRLQGYPLTDRRLQVFQETLVVIAYMPNNVNVGGKVNEPISKSMTVWALAATIMSLIQSGLGRIVVSGRLLSDELWVQEAFQIVNSITKDWNRDYYNTQLQFCQTANAATGDFYTPYNIPKAALKQLRRVFMGNATAAKEQCWLNDNKNWNYIHLTEPDMMLVTRPSSVNALSQALRNDKVLSPHRLQPVPHASDFGNLFEKLDSSAKYNAVPSIPPFRHVISINNYTSWSCCDQGNFRPWSVFGECGNAWWTCGFYIMRQEEGSLNDQTIIENVTVHQAHQRLLVYPLVRLTQSGTGVVFAGTETGRQCRPTMGECDVW